MTLSYIPSDTNAEGILKAPASGVLPNGKPVVVNADGTVSVVSSESTTGSAVVFNTGETDPTVRSLVYDTNLNKIIVAYSDWGNSGYGMIVVGTASGSSISFGSEVAFNSGETSYPSLSFDSTSNKVVVSYRDGANSNYGTAKVGTVSGTSISFGSAVVFESAAVTYLAPVFDDANNKTVIAFKSGSTVEAIVGTVSGTSISFGTKVQASSSASHASCTYDTANNKVVIAYNASDVGKCRVGTVSGTGISFGSEATFHNTNAISINMCYDSTAGKVVIAYSDNGASAHGKAVVGTISSTSISFGSPTTFNAAGTEFTTPVFNALSNKVGIAFRDQASANGRLVNGTVSGTSITVGSATTFASATLQQGAVYDPDGGSIFFAYKNTGNSNYGTAVGVSSTNLTSENYIGMSSGVVDVNSVAQAAGSSTVFEAANSAYISATFDSNSNKVVIAFRDDGDSGKGKAIVGTVSGTSISFGSAAVFYSGFSNYIVASFDSSNNKVVIAYEDDNNSDYGTAIVGTVSGTNISFGSATVFESARSDHITSTFNSTSGKIVIAYTDVGNSSTLTAIVGTVSGTSISFGTAVAVTGNPQGYYNSITSESASSKIVIGYTNGSNSNYGTAVVGTVSSTSISFGTPVVFESATATFSSATFDSTSGKVVIAYTDGGNSSYGTAIVGTVSNTSISFGDATVFESGSSSEFSASFDPLSNSVVVAYRDNGNSNYITFAIGSVSGSSVSFSSPVVFDTAGSEYISSVAYGNEAKVVIAYKDAGNSNYGTAGVIQPAYTYITRGEVPSGSQAITNIIGSVSSIQTGLTAGQSYFVQTDGTIGLTAANPSVFAGTAVSATKLIVKT